MRQVAGRRSVEAPVEISEFPLSVSSSALFMCDVLLKAAVCCVLKRSSPDLRGNTEDC